jgi:hypothetical protein
MKRVLQAAFAACVLACSFVYVGAQAFTDVGLAKKSLESTKESWVEFGVTKAGQQIIRLSYFAVYKCTVKLLKYSFDTRTVDKSFALPKCDPNNPFKIDDPNKFLLPAKNVVKSFSIQLVYADGTLSPVRTYEPCSFDDGGSCTRLVRETPAQPQPGAGAATGTGNGTGL